MRLELHQLDRRWEHLRVRRPERQRKLMASLAAIGQQMPILVSAVEGEAHRYLVVDGYQRVAALEQLGRDTIEAVVCALSESQALVLGRSLAMNERATALEEGWLLQELEQRHGYGLEKLAQHFDRSLSWVSRRLALVELLPVAVQQKVRSGEISAHVAMKYLVPVARAHPDDCLRMAEVMAAHKFTSREAGQFYDAWRGASAAIRERLLERPQLFLKTQRSRNCEQPVPAITAVLRDLEIATAIARRAQRRLVGVLDLDEPQCRHIHRQVRRAMEELQRLAMKIPSPPEEPNDVKPKSTQRDSGTARPRDGQTFHCLGPEDQPAECTQSAALQLSCRAQDPAQGESRTLSPADP